MRFEYVPYSGNWLPLIPVTFAHGKKRLPIIHALVDTGATHTILPLEFASELGMDIDLDDRIESQIAGGGRCFIYPSRSPIEHVISESMTIAEYKWHSQVFFAQEQEIPLLGHHQCLEKFDVLFRGRKKCLEITHLNNGKERS